MLRGTQNRTGIFASLAIMCMALLFLISMSPRIAHADPSDTPEFKIQVTISGSSDTSRTFYLPTSGGLNPSGGSSAALDKNYSWDVDWGDNANPTFITYTQSDSANTMESDGIKHTYNAAGTYTITITPTDQSEEAWLGSFGFSGTGMGASATGNCNKVTAVLSPITPSMTRTAAQIAGTAPAPSHEWATTFRGCENITMGQDFTFDADAWNGVTSVGNNFAGSMFTECTGNNFTMNSVFNLPQNITEAGDSFASGMFDRCRGNSFDMNSVFNLPQGITEVGNGFASSMFSSCHGSGFTMNSVFNLPQGITEVGDYFAYSLFYGCYGSNFTMNSVFNLPQGITKLENGFARSLFYLAGGQSFQINDVFRFPVLNTTTLNTDESFYWAFGNMDTNTPEQKRSAHSIVNGNEAPLVDRITFFGSKCFADRLYLDSNWGGGGDPSTFYVSFVARNGAPAEPSYYPATQSFTTADSLVAKPSTDPTIPGYVFKGWYKEAACTNAWSFETDKVSENTYLYAKWAALYTIDVSAGAGGSITPATIDVEGGSNQSFTITPNENYVVEDVLVDGVSVGAVTSYTFTNVTEAHSIEVIFMGPYLLGTLTDLASNISATALFHDSAELSVVKDRLHPAETCQACATIKAKYDAGELYSIQDVNVAGFKPGTQVEVVLPIDAQYNGSEVMIYHCKNGELESFPTRVQGDLIKAKLEHFSPIGIGKPVAAPTADKNTLSNTGDDAPWIYPVVTLVLSTSVLLIGAYRATRKQQ